LGVVALVPHHLLEMALQEVTQYFQQLHLLVAAVVVRNLLIPQMATMVALAVAVVARPEQAVLGHRVKVTMVEMRLVLVPLITLAVAAVAHLRLVEMLQQGQ
jgi:hypothetical protein